MHEEFPEWHCFAHVLPKGRYPDFKTDANNIKLVCSIKCHNDLDRLVDWKKNQIYKQICIGRDISLEDIKLL